MLIVFYYKKKLENLLLYSGYQLKQRLTAGQSIESSGVVISFKWNIFFLDRSSLIFISITVEWFLHKVLIYKFFSRYSVLFKVTLLSLSEFFLLIYKALLNS